MTELPVAEVAEEVVAALEERGRAVLTAPPGAGKSTLLPLVLLKALPEGRILMLEPRRIAARQVAARMAFLLGERVGETVGYRVRFDTKVSARTRIEVITEGIMERMLIDDPTLDGVAAVIFDEFHERSLSSDLSLCLTREIQAVLRSDLQILVMSATIDGASLAKSMDAAYIDSPGRCHEVKIIYGEDIDAQEIPQAMASAIRKAWRQHDGNILAFLPGQGEILRCRDLLGDAFADTEILPLYGNLPPEQQQRVMASPSPGMRRIILASPIAETSLTLDGISVVVDGGYYRAPLYQPTTGLSRLVTTRISLDMATQRAGRAGRLMPGVCYRLWSKGTEARMKDCRQPEILTADLSSLMLQLIAWGEQQPLRLPWVTPPPKGHLEEGLRLLRLLGLIKEEGTRPLSEKGRAILRMPCHPRIANMLTEAGPLHALACDVAALLEEKDPIHDETDADLYTRLEALRRTRQGRPSGPWKRIDNIAAQYRRDVPVARQPRPTSARHSDRGPADGSQPRPYSQITPTAIGAVLANAYPERIAMRDPNGQYRLACGGRPLALHPDDDLARHEFLVVASMGSKIFLAAPIEREEVERRGVWSAIATWDSREARAVVREELRVGMLTLATRQAKGDIQALTVAAIAAAAPKEGLSMFDFNDEVKELQLRIAAVASWHPELDLPDVSTETVLSAVSEWLPMYIGKASAAQDLRKIDLRQVIVGMLSYEQQLALDRLAPTHVKLPTGRTARIRYRRGAEAPIVSARLQDCFGMTQTPTVDGGKRKVLMELLSPGFKPVQLTQDMENFWHSSYLEIRKELRRRYPKHAWPLF